MTNYIPSVSIGSVLPPVLTNGLLKALNSNQPHALPGNTGDKPDFKCQAYLEALAKWILPIYLMGGTLAMRSARTTYLPQEAGESDPLYESRLTRTVLFGAYSRTIKVLSSLPFIDPIQVKKPPALLEYINEKGKASARLEQICRTLVTERIHLGVSFLYVENPEIPEGADYATEKQFKPYFITISALDLINWRFDSDGELDMFTYYSYDTENDGDFGEKVVHKIHQVSREALRRYESRDSDKWELVKDIPNNTGRINLIPIGDFGAAPLLEELAWQNLRHYQKQSDLDNIEHACNVPFLFGSGIEESAADKMVVGPFSFITSSQPDAKLGFVEHQGNAIPSSQKSIDNIEKRMVQMGADIITQTSVARQTAFAKAVDTGQSMSILEAVVQDVSSAIERGYYIVADELDVELPSDFEVIIGEGIELSRSPEDASFLKELAMDGFLRVEDLQFELSRRGKISDTTKLEKPKPQEVVAPLNEDNNLNPGVDDTAPSTNQSQE